MESGQSLFDSMAVVGDVLLVVSAERFGRGHACVVAFPHLLGREVGVSAGAVPIALDRLGVEPCGDAPVLLARDVDVPSDAVQEPSGDPDLVGDFGSAQWTDLVLPLCWHHFRVDAGYHQSCFETGIQMGFDDWTSIDFVRSDAAVVPSLRSREAVFWPSQRLDAIEEGVLLLEAEPHIEIVVLLRCRRASRSGI